MNVHENKQSTMLKESYICVQKGKMEPSHSFYLTINYWQEEGNKTLTESKSDIPITKGGGGGSIQTKCLVNGHPQNEISKKGAKHETGTVESFKSVGGLHIGWISYQYEQ